MVGIDDYYENLYYNLNPDYADILAPDNPEIPDPLKPPVDEPQPPKPPPVQALSQAPAAAPPTPPIIINNTSPQQITKKENYEGDTDSQYNWMQVIIFITIIYIIADMYAKVTYIYMSLRTPVY